MKTIEVGQKWICIKTYPYIYETDGTSNVVATFKIGDIIEITHIDLTLVFPYYTDDIPMSYEEIEESFISLAEFRDKRINEILEDD
jgi:hypothetical protein